jgi:hypothetical protein
MKAALLGALVIGAFSTAADFVWATWIDRATIALGLLHGSVLFLAIGLFLGTLTGRPLQGATGGLVAGLAGAGIYYALVPAVGFSAMFVAWFALWILLALICSWLRGRPELWSAAIARGVVAGLGSGLAFYLISGIWRPFNPEGLDYVVHLVSWTFAYFPGFAALLISRPGHHARS